jgi:hypothetical protein
MNLETSGDETTELTVAVEAAAPQGVNALDREGSARNDMRRDPAVSEWLPPVPDDRAEGFMRPSGGVFDFNKQILFGEIGAIVGIQLAPLVTSAFTAAPSILALAAVLGGQFAGSVAWIVMKRRDERRRGPNSVLNLAVQIAYFSPAAFIVGLIVYQPTLFLVTRHLLKDGNLVAYSALISQIAAFSLFLVAINIYRIALYWVSGKRI